MKKSSCAGLAAALLLLAGCSDSGLGVLPGAPGKDKIEADLVGRHVCNWSIDSIREFRKLEITDQTSSSEIFEYDLALELEGGGDDRILTARAIYKKRGGEWALDSFAEKTCTSTAEIQRIAEQKKKAWSRYTDNKDGTITDSKTGLMWKRCAEGQSGDDCSTGEAIELAWKPAMEHAKAARFAGYDDWRLPSKDELLSIVDKSYRPTIDPYVFPHTPGSYFWSASTVADSSNYAWYVHFDGGYSDGYNRNNYIHVRLV